MTSSDTPWQTATASAGTGGCAQLRRHDGKAEVRDTKLGDESPVLRFNRKELAALLDGVKKGEFDHLLDDLA